MRDPLYTPYVDTWCAYILLLCLTRVHTHQHHSRITQQLQTAGCCALSGMDARVDHGQPNTHP